MRPSGSKHNERTMHLRHVHHCLSCFLCVKGLEDDIYWFQNLKYHYTYFLGLCRKRYPCIKRNRNTYFVEQNIFNFWWIVLIAINNLTLYVSLIPIFIIISFFISWSKQHRVPSRINLRHSVMFLRTRLLLLRGMWLTMEHILELCDFVEFWKTI